MPAWIAPLATTLGPPIISGLGSLFGGERRNTMQQVEAAKTRAHQTAEAGRSMAFSGAQAEKSMAFAERMRNTSWQAGLSDMQAAGINPALAYSMGGASSPMGTAGSGATGGGAMAQIEDTLSPAISSAKHSMRLRQELKNMKEQALLTETMDFKARQDTRVAHATEDLVDANRKNVNMKTVGESIRNQLQLLSIPTAQNVARHERGIIGRNKRGVSAVTGALGNALMSLVGGGFGALLGKALTKRAAGTMWSMTQPRP